MIESAIQSVDEGLNAVILELRASYDPRVRRDLLIKMRLLMIERDQLLARSALSYSTHSAQ